MDPIKTEFKKRRSIQIVISISTIPVLVFLYFLTITENDQFFGFSILKWIIGIAILFIILIIYSLKNWRCPKCNSNLGNDSFNPKTCSNCRIGLM